MDNESSLSLKYVKLMENIINEREAKYKDGTNLGIQYLLQQPKIRMYCIIGSSSVGGPLAAVRACYDNIRYLGYKGKIEFIYNDYVEIEPNDTESVRYKKIKHFNNVKRIFPTFPDTDHENNDSFIRCRRSNDINKYYNNHSYGCTYGEIDIEEVNLGFLGNNEGIGNCRGDINVLNCKVVLCGMNVGFISGIGSKYKNNSDVDTLHNTFIHSNPKLSTYLYHQSVIKFNNDTFRQQISSIKENEIQKRFLTNLHYLVNTDQIHFMLAYGQGPKFSNVIKMVYEAINQLRDFKPVVLYYIKTAQSNYIDFESEKIGGKGKWRMARYREPDVKNNKPDGNDYFLESSDWTKFIRECDEHFNCEVCNTIDKSSCDRKTIIGDEQDKILHSQLLTVYGGGFSNELFISLAKMSTLPVILEGAGFLNDCLRNGIPFLIGTDNFGCGEFINRIEPKSHLCKVAKGFDNETENADYINSINSLKKILAEVGEPDSDTGKFYSKIFNTVNHWNHSLLYFLLDSLDIGRLETDTSQTDTSQITPEQIKEYFSKLLNDDEFKKFCTRLSQTDGFTTIKEDLDSNERKSDLKDYIGDIASWIEGEYSLKDSIEAAVIEDDNYKNELEKFFNQDMIQQSQAPEPGAPTQDQAKEYFSKLLNDDEFKKFCTRLSQTDGFTTIKEDLDSNERKSDLKDYIGDIASWIEGEYSLKDSIEAAVIEDDNYKNELEKFFNQDMIQQAQAQAPEPQPQPQPQLTQELIQAQAQVKHGEECSKEEKNTYRRVEINGKEVDLICKKSKKILGLGRKLKSSLKKENGTLSFGKYGKKLNNKTCMKNPCWHKLSGLDKKRKTYKTWKIQKNLTTQRGGYREKSKRKTNKNKMLKKTKRVKKLYKKVSKKTKNKKVLKSKRLKKSRKNKN